MCESCLLWVCLCLSFLFNFLMLYFYFVLCMPCVSMCVSIQYGWLNYLQFLTHFFFSTFWNFRFSTMPLSLASVTCYLNSIKTANSQISYFKWINWNFYFFCYDTQQSHHFRSILFFVDSWVFFVLLIAVKDWN